jgi:hypothetical protein
MQALLHALSESVLSTGSMYCISTLPSLGGHVIARFTARHLRQRTVVPPVIS